VLLSHDHHLDNLDEAGRAFLPRAGRVVTTTEGAQRLGGNAVGLDPYDTLDVDGSPVRITAVPAHHGPAEFVEENGPVIGFVLQADALPAVYVSGDNASVDVVREIVERIGRIEIAVLFAGAARVATKAGGAPLTLTSTDAAEAARVLGARTVIPIHHLGWRHYSEGAPDLRRAFTEAGLGDRLAIAAPGETVTAGLT
jgi:L-ascorbate metabolism protein UlaG (beta-lactamase superfamily)